MFLYDFELPALKTYGWKFYIVDIQPSINDFKAIAATDSSIHLSVQRSDCIERYVVNKFKL